MFGIFKKKDNKSDYNNLTKGEVLKLKIDGMHCTSCSMNVDGELEDLDGVMNASTSYAKQISTVEYDPTKVSQKEIEAVIIGLGYTIK